MSTIVTGVAVIVTVLLLGAMVLTAWRLAAGPTQADRIIALDVMAMAMVGAVAGLAVMHDDVEVLDVAVATALVAFVSTTAVAWYLQRRGES
jgi:multicomponent Na+:H+ antiporter subunit F